MDSDDREKIEQWIGTLAEALQVDKGEFDVDGILDIAGMAARSVVRPAAPVTTFLVGYALGRSGRDETNGGVDLESASQTVRHLLDDR
jgi:hypothetical protein